MFDDDSSYESIQIGGLNRNKIESLHIKANIINKRFEINHADIEQFYISYSNLETEMIIANCNIKNITFDNFRNNGFLKFSNCKAIENLGLSEFIINQTNMGKTEFFKFNFASFNSINITNSIILDCLFINSYWSKYNMVSKELPFTQTLISIDDSRKKIKADNLKEVYKQIKYALDNQGDKVQERFFHGLEMNEYNKTLSWKNNFWTKIILKLSFWTSNYGQSFLLPLIWIVVTNSLLFFFLFVLHATKYSIIQIANFENWLNTIASILNFMNPLHKSNEDLSGLPLIIDTFDRIFSSYFIYNIIRATRRFVQ